MINICSYIFCSYTLNSDQTDTDGDLNNDGNTNTLDLNLCKLAHLTMVDSANYNVDAGFNGDGSINIFKESVIKT